MRAVLVERHRLGGAGIDLGTTTFDLGVPRCSRVRVGLTIETPKKLERQTRSFFGGKPKDLCQDVRRSHSNIIADVERSEPR